MADKVIDIPAQTQKLIEPGKVSWSILVLEL
jgi:hypothetical protein